MPIVLAKSKKWIFVASTIDEGTQNLPVRKAGESDQLFADRNQHFLEELEASFKPLLPTAQSFHVARLCHGDCITKVSDGEASHFYDQTDGLTTNVIDAVLRVSGADCPSVLIVDEGSSQIALAHSGRVGTLSNIVGKAVQQLVTAGSDPASLSAIIGPGICGKHYEVSQEIIDQFVLEYSGAIQGRNLDLKKIIRMQLQKTGVLDSAIQDLQECTFEMPEKWFSYRRDVGEGLSFEYPRIHSFVGMILDERQ